MLSNDLILTLPFFSLLLILSIFSISLITEKVLLFYRWRCHTKNLHSKLSAQLKKGEIDSLEKLIENPYCPEALLIQKSLHFIKYELEAAYPIIMATQEQFPKLATPSRTLYDSDKAKHHEGRLELWIHTCIEEFSLQLEKHINLFHLIANVATLLGLLGTVTGMIYAFQSGALEQSTQLAQGISQALITTAGGLVVAIPAIISQQLFQNAIGIRISKLEQLGRSIVFFQHKRIDAQISKSQLRALKKETPVDLTKLQSRLSLKSDQDPQKTLRQRTQLMLEKSSPISEESRAEA